jgi:hypothetical protein
MVEKGGGGENQDHTISGDGWGTAGIYNLSIHEKGECILHCNTFANNIHGTHP